MPGIRTLACVVLLALAAPARAEELDVAALWALIERLVSALVGLPAPGGVGPAGAGPNAGAAGGVVPGLTGLPPVPGMLGQGADPVPGLPPPLPTQAQGAAGPAQAWTGVKRWAYQLQGADPGELAGLKADLVVIDPTKGKRGEGAFSRAEVAQVQAGGKKVLAYFSIGEAESYRAYWQPGWRPGNPPWLGAENPDWPGNFTVKYWDPAWQALLFGSPGAALDRILATGVDGVYLDIIDGYERFPDRASAKADMIALVTRIAGYGRARAGAGFGVFPQNAVELAEDPRYLAVITGVGQEEVYFTPEDQATDAEHRAGGEAKLDRVVAAGKLALTVDYCRQAGNVGQVFQRTLAKGYVGYCAGRELDRIGNLMP